MGMQTKAPGAGATVPGAKGVEISLPTPLPIAEASPKSNARARVRVRVPQGVFAVRGQTAKAPIALIEAGAAGRTALVVTSWAYRFGAYVHVLRRDFGRAIATKREPHGGGWHGHNVLASPVSILEPMQ